MGCVSIYLCCLTVFISVNGECVCVCPRVRARAHALQACAATLGFLHGCYGGRGDPNRGPHASTGSTFLTEPAPSTMFYHLHCTRFFFFFKNILLFLRILFFVMLAIWDEIQMLLLIEIADFVFHYIINSFVC